jgi:hypothetical protein
LPRKKSKAQAPLIPNVLNVLVAKHPAERVRGKASYLGEQPQQQLFPSARG